MTWITFVDKIGVYEIALAKKNSEKIVDMVYIKIANNLLLLFLLLQYWRGSRDSDRIFIFINYSSRHISSKGVINNGVVIHSGIVQLNSCRTIINRANYRYNDKGQITPGVGGLPEGVGLKYLLFHRFCFVHFDLCNIVYTDEPVEIESLVNQKAV